MIVDFNKAKSQEHSNLSARTRLGCYTDSVLQLCSFQALDALDMEMADLFANEIFRRNDMEKE